MVNQSLAQDTPSGQAGREQAAHEQARFLAAVAASLVRSTEAERDRALKDALREYRASTDLPALIAAENAAQNDALRVKNAHEQAQKIKQDDEQQAIRDGMAVYRDRRSTGGPTVGCSSTDLVSVDQAARAVFSRAVNAIKPGDLQKYGNLKRAAYFLDIKKDDDPDKVQKWRVEAKRLRALAIELSDRDRAIVAARYGVELPDEFAIWLLSRPADEHLSHLHAWQRTAQRASDEGRDPGNLRALLGVTLAPASEDATQDDHDARYTLHLGVYPRMAAAANKRGLAAASFLYWILQHRAQHGHSDKFTLAELHEYMRRLGIDRSPRWIRDALRRGRGVFWQVKHRAKRDRRQHVYAMRGKKLVLVSLGFIEHPEDADPIVHEVGGRSEIADAAWRADLTTWSAHVYAAYVLGHPGNGNAPRRTLAKGYGISRRTAIEYDRIAGTIVKPQEVEVIQPKPGDTAKWAEIKKHQTAYQWRRVERWRTASRKFGRVWYCWQDVNVYSSDRVRTTSHQRRCLLRGLQALVSDASFCSVEFAPLADASHTAADPEPVPAGTAPRRFSDPERAREYQREHAAKPVKLPGVERRRHAEYKRPPAWRTWRFEHSEAAYA